MARTDSRTRLWLFLAGFVACAAQAQQVPDDTLRHAPADPAVTEAATRAADDGGSGAYRALMTVDTSLQTHTIYRPADLAPFDETSRLPIVVWANGACANIGNRFRYFLTEIASHGYFVIAVGPIGPPQVESGGSATQAARSDTDPVDPRDRPQDTHWRQLIDAMDWAVAEADRDGGPYFRKLDPARIAVMGMSCGGLQAILASADPRAATTMIWNSGTYPRGGRILVGAEATKASLADLHAPIAYVTGDERDVAFENANDDFDLIDHVPIVRAWQHGLGHAGSFRTPNGGSFGQVAVAWLDWQFRGKADAARWFVGEDCMLCRDESWTIRTKNID